MRKQTNRCTCDTTKETFELNDEFKSIACTTCYEIISYEIIETTKTKTKKQSIRGTISDFINILQNANERRKQIC